MSWIREQVVKRVESLTGRRSRKWPKVRRAHIKKHPRCAICKRKKGAEVHHIADWSTYPELELDPENLITLCRKRCHLLFGHLMNWKSINPLIISDVWVWVERIKNRRAA